MKCPSGHRWWKCRHPELAQPVLGKIMMSIGAFTALVGIAEILRG